MRRTAAPLLVLLPLVLILATALCAAADAAPGEKRRILLIGLDGADWQIIDPLIEQGRLPHLAKLKRTGAHASLRSGPEYASCRRRRG